MSHISIKWMPHSQIKKEWCSIRKSIKRAMKRVDPIYSLANIEEMLLDGRLLIYDVNGQGYMILRIAAYGQKRVLEVFMLSLKQGALSATLESSIIGLIEAKCKVEGATEWITYGRNWIKKIKKYRPNAISDVRVRVVL